MAFHFSFWHYGSWSTPLLQYYKEQEHSESGDGHGGLMGHLQDYASRGVYVPFVTECEELLVFNPNPDLCQWHNLQYEWPPAVTYIGWCELVIYVM